MVQIVSASKLSPKGAEAAARDIGESGYDNRYPGISAFLLSGINNDHRTSRTRAKADRNTASSGNNTADQSTTPSDAILDVGAVNRVVNGDNPSPDAEAAAAKVTELVHQAMESEGLSEIRAVKKVAAMVHPDGVSPDQEASRIVNSML